MQIVVDSWVEQYERLKEILSELDIIINEHAPRATRNALIARKNSLEEEVFNEAMMLLQFVFKGEM